MPRQLAEIKNFGVGTILNASEKDIPENSPAYSLNISPVSENGILTSINCDKLFLAMPENSTSLSAPISWNSVNNTSAVFNPFAEQTNEGLHRFHVNDISIFNSENISNFSYVGTKGYRENVLATDVRPWYEKVLDSGGSVLSYSPSANVGKTDDYFPYSDLDEYLEVGDYFSLNTGAYSANEIIQVESFNTTNSKMFVKRGCFGTKIESYASASSFNVYANKITIDGIQNKTNRGILSVFNESNYSGNHIGGNSTYLNQCKTAANKAILGGAIPSGTYNVSYDSTAKTISIAGLSSVPFYEGDTINVYHSATSTSNGFSAKILKIAGSSPIVLTLDTAPPTTETESSDTVYIEANLIKNHTFTHKQGTTGSLASTYACNDWSKHSFKNVNPESTARYNNTEETSTSSNVAIVTSGGGYWETSVGNLDLGAVADNADEFYPFVANDVYLKLTAGYGKAGNTTGVCDLTNDLGGSANNFKLVVSRDANDILALEDIIKINNEYMRVLAVKDKQVFVARGEYGSTIASHTAGDDIEKNIGYIARQTISKDLLKEGQDYVLSFYAKTGDEGDSYSHGALSMTFNGGYLNSGGNWIKFEGNNIGYTDNPVNITKQIKWVDFKYLDKPYNDTAVVGTSTNPCGMDNNWRLFSFRFKMPKGVKLTTDVELDLTCRGKDTDEVWIDLINLMEDTRIINLDNNSLLKTNIILDNQGKKDLISYDSIRNRIQAITDIFNNPEIIDNFTKSPFAASSISSSIKDATIVANNREVHLGFGGKNSDTPPQWLGYVNHKLFGQSYDDSLYQDEDTVHKYGGEGVGNLSLSKICLAGEHERVAVSWSSPDLSVSHIGHSLNIGDNIVIREWMDVDNSWDGNGIWIVKTTTTNAFTCVRATTYDKDPASGPSNNFISWRPYYYYGIKDGDNCIYRIWPDTKLGGGGSGDDSLNTLSTTYTKGKIERSLPLDTPVTSICTYYSKATSGRDGGRVYVLSSVKNEVYVYDVQKKYNNWETSELSEISNIDLQFKSFKWSNDNINGNIGGDTEVFQGLAEESSPSINYAGILSDIIETKGPTSDVSNLLDANVTGNNSIILSNFDTRLWIQSRPGVEGFTEGDRFLFCALTNSTNTDGPDVLYCADRTPPTSMATNTLSRFTSNGSIKFKSGPGLRNHPRSIFSHSLETSGSGDDSYDHKVDVISTVIDSDGNTSPGISKDNNYKKSYVSFGSNVGWDAGDDNSNELSIKVAKYGLFQIADNDGDGILDGTGVVVPNDETITDTTNKTGPYGKLHQKVSAHAVGVMGGCNLNWVKHYGRMHGNNNSRLFLGGDGNGPTEDAPENISVDKCIFVSTDMHYGDDQPNEEYTFNAVTAIDTNEKTDLTINSTGGTTGLEVGDTIYVTDINKSAVITNVDISNNKIRIAVDPTTFSGTTGTIYPHAIATTLYHDKGGVLNDEKMFHWSFDSRNPNNGDIFTEGQGSGNYVKTYMTPPSYWGGTVTDSYSYANPLPGILYKIEKLSYRGGVMIRPFSMDNTDFNDLMIGNGVSVDLPSFPNPVYHSNNGSAIFDNRNNSSVNNSFATKLFITCPIENDEDQRSRMYICDLDFQYPSQATQVEKIAYNQSSGQQILSDETTNSVNDGNSWNMAVTGIIADYDITDRASTVLQGDNSLHPTIDITVSEIELNKSLFESGHYKDKENSLAGMCITILDQTTGTTQTRYITGSKENSGTLTIKVHYPFGHSPADDDKFWIWSHSNVCTTPIRLYKTENIPNFDDDVKSYSSDPIGNDAVYNDNGSVSIATDGVVTTTNHHNLTTNDKIRISGTDTYDEVYQITVTGPNTLASIGSSSDVETGTWHLLEGADGETSSSNPLALNLTSPIFKTTFGGLDMRKSKKYDTNGSDFDANLTNPEIRVTTDAHLLVAGDTVTLDSPRSQHDGTYIIKSVRVNDFDVDNPDTTDENNPGTVHTNQWESLISDTTAKSYIGELRAGLTCWDKGNIAGNIIRYDSTAESDRYIAFNQSSIEITSVSLPNQTGDYFAANNTYYYKVSFIYDGYQEGPLSDAYWTYSDSATRSKLSIKIQLKDVSRRLTSVCLYRKDNFENNYALVEEIPTDSGWSNEGEYYTKEISDSGALQASYEARTGLSEVLDTISVKYGISAEIDGYLFVGDCSHSKIEKASNMVFRSKPGKYSIFDYANDFLTLKSKPTAFANFLGRLYIFDDLNIYRVNPESLIIEDIYEGIGCFGKDSLVITEFGLFFANKTGIYYHDGKMPVRISEAIQKAGGTDETFGGTDNIKDCSWENIINNNSNAKPYLFYDARINSILVNIELVDKDSTYNKAILRQYIWSYNIPRKRWDLWELAEDSEVGKPFTGESGEILIPINNAIYENRGGITKRDWTWVSKKLTMNEDSIMKVFNKVKINGLSNDLNLGGSYIESSDRLFIVTSTGNVDSNNITYAQANIESSDYKLSGSNKKGRWMQFKIENVKEDVDSIGIIFRRKSTK